MVSFSIFSGSTKTSFSLAIYHDDQFPEFPVKQCYKEPEGNSFCKWRNANHYFCVFISFIVFFCDHDRLYLSQKHVEVDP